MKKKFLNIALLSTVAFSWGQNINHSSYIYSNDVGAEKSQSNSFVGLKDDTETIVGKTWIAKKIGDDYILSINFDEQIISSIEDFVKTENLGSGEITGIGAVNEVELGIYDFDKEKFITKKFNEPMEITNASGNIAYKKDKLYIHMHITLGNTKFQAYAGHLVEGRIHGAGEFYIRTNPIKLYKTKDDTSLWSYEFENK